jgi:hypothetical protein
MLGLYFASILDHKGQEVLNLQFTVTAKHSAFIAGAFIKECPPAQGFKINKIFIDAKAVASMLNNKGH